MNDSYSGIIFYFFFFFRTSCTILEYYFFGWKGVWIESCSGFEIVHFLGATRLWNNLFIEGNLERKTVSWSFAAILDFQSFTRRAFEDSGGKPITWNIA